jgi:hypothetical protein
VRRVALPVGLAAVFGAADQYLGSRGFALGFWAIDVSLLSAPWLLVAFFAGWSQRTALRAVILGLVCTFAALAGYWLMTLSPIEGAQMSVRAVRGLLFSQSRLVAGGLVCGPLFGWLGYRWRVNRDIVSALVAALAVCFEPLAHAAVGDAVSFRGVWAAESVAGVLMLLYAANEVRRPKT